MGIKAALVPLVAVCLLLGGLVFIPVLNFPHHEGRFKAGNGEVVYTRPDGVQMREVVLSGPPDCMPPAVALRPSDIAIDLRLFDDTHSRVESERQTQIRCLLRPGAMVAGRAGGAVTTFPLNVRAREIGDLGLAFWGPIFIGFVAALVSGWVWSLRPNETATRLFAISGFSFMVCYYAQAVFKSHGLGYEPRLFEALYLINELSNQVFFLSLVALFLQYPVRLVTGWKVWTVAAVGLLYVVMVLTMPARIHLFSLCFTVLGLFAMLCLLGCQWWVTRRKPGERAALVWLGLSVLVGASLWAVLLLITERLGLSDVMSEIVIVLMFFPFYLGLAMGVARFCLVELQDWTFRILFFIMAALLFATIDIALIALAGMAGGTALAVALFAIAFLYLPLRDALWRRFVKPRGMSRPDMFAAVMEIAFAPTPGQRRTRWEALVGRLFEPLKIEPTEDISEARIEANGLKLVLPAVADSPALSLEFARQGRELFSPAQLALVRQLIALVRTAATSRDAYERGAAEERRRMAQDLHDDVGARLVGGLAVADGQTRPILQGALSDIRAIAGGMMGREAPLDRVLADIRHECVRRLEAAGVDVSWPLWPEDAPLVLADYRLQKALASGLREVVSNIIRHSGAGRVEIELRLDGDRIVCHVRDDGGGLPDAVLSGDEGGQGLKGLVRRFAEAGGSARFGNRKEGGATTELQLPLQP